MSVIIRGMKIPENCGMCDLAHRNFDGNETRLACYALRKWAEESGDVRLPDCPLVELPEKHGELIDRDALNLEYEVQMADDWNTAHEIANCVKYAPTVIEAEGEE